MTNDDPHFQAALLDNNLSPETTKGQFVAFLLKRTLKRLVIGVVIASALILAALFATKFVE